MVKRGEKGDASVLKPSIMFCVPLILDRIYKVDDLAHVADDLAGADVLRPVHPGLRVEWRE